LSQGGQGEREKRDQRGRDRVWGKVAKAGVHQAKDQAQWEKGLFGLVARNVVISTFPPKARKLLLGPGQFSNETIECLCSSWRNLTYTFMFLFPLRRLIYAHCLKRHGASAAQQHKKRIAIIWERGRSPLRIFSRFPPSPPRMHALHGARDIACTFRLAKG
jgi:hypothetical protein